MCWQLVPADLVGQECAQLVKRKGPGAGLQLHERLGGFAAIIIRHGDHADFGHGGMLVDRFLDGARIDVEIRPK